MRACLVRLLSVLGLLASASLAMAQSMPADAPNARDHAVLSRYAGSWLVTQDAKTFDQASIPSGDTDVVKRGDAAVLSRARRQVGARSAAQL
jgi:hypothetical protein